MRNYLGSVTNKEEIYKCKECKESFRHKRTLKEHEKKHNNKKERTHKKYPDMNIGPK